MNKETLLLDEIGKKIDRLINLTLLLKHSEISGILRAELDTREKRQIYELTDGVRSVREIADLTGANISTISRLSQRWERLGIIVESSKKSVTGRRERLFDLSAFEFNLGEK